MLNRVYVVPFSAKSKSSSTDKKITQAAINNLVQQALNTGNWSALAEYNPTKSQLNTALSKSTYKKAKNLSVAQTAQMAQAYAGNFNEYESNSSTTIKAADTSSDDGRAETEAAAALNAQALSAEQIEAYKNLLSQYNNLEDNYVRPDYTNVTDAQLRSLGDLQSQLGTNINYDYNAIKGIYDDATRSAYDIEQNSGAERSYYKHLADAQNTALDTIRSQYGAAVAQGASKGMQAAQQLSAILGVSQTANEEATQLALDKQARANEYAGQMAQNAKDALSYSNQQQMDLASLSRQLYNDDIQAKTAELSYNQGINQDYANYMTGRQTALGSLQGSLANTAAGIYNNNQSAIAQLQSAISQANATKYAADRQKSAASKNVKTTT